MCQLYQNCFFPYVALEYLCLLCFVLNDINTQDDKYFIYTSLWRGASMPHRHILYGLFRHQVNVIQRLQSLWHQLSKVIYRDHFVGHLCFFQASYFLKQCHNIVMK